MITSQHAQGLLFPKVWAAIPTLPFLVLRTLACSASFEI